MSIKTTTFYDSGAARRRIIYGLCAVVVAGCGVALFLLSRGSGEPADEPTDRSAAPETPAPETPAPGEDAPPLPEVAPPPAVPRHPGMEKLDEAHRLFDSAQEHMKTATGDPSSEEGRAALRKTLEILLSAQAAYEAYLEEFPAQEDRLSRRLADLQRELYWCRKSMPASDFPSTADTSPREPSRTPPPADRKPPEARPPSRPPPAFKPAHEVRRFVGVARKALRDGRPDRILEVGEPLVSDPRMSEHLESIERTVLAARRMAAFLEAVRVALSAHEGEDVALRLRAGEVAGTLVSAAGEIIVKTGEEERTIRLSDLAAAELIERAKAALEDPADRLAAGAYLLLRGDEDPGARQILIARAAGADISSVEPQLTRVVAASVELKAFSDWLRLEPLLPTGGPDLPTAVDEFKAKHRTTRCFEERREEIFTAAAKAVADHPVTIEDVFAVAPKLSGKRGIKLTYPFDAPGELADFGTEGDFKIEEGKLLGARGSLWLDRFLTESLDLRFVLESPVAAVIGIWGNDTRGTNGINLTLAPDGGELTLTLRHRNREIAKETVKAPSGPLELFIQRRDKKYQVRLNRKAVLKGTDVSNRSTEGLTRVGFLSRGEGFALHEVELKTDLDLDWARAGGHRHTNYIRDWYVAGPFAVDPDGKSDGAVEQEEWPETTELEPDGPDWKFHRSAVYRLWLTGMLKPNKLQTAYAAIRVWSPDRRSAALEVEADDVGRAWLNGDLVLKRAPAGQAHRVAVKLKPGENLLLVKAAEVSGKWWWLSARFLTKSGEAMRDLQYW